MNKVGKKVNRITPDWNLNKKKTETKNVKRISIGIDIFCIVIISIGPHFMCAHSLTLAESQWIFVGFDVTKFEFYCFVCFFYIIVVKSISTSSFFYRKHRIFGLLLRSQHIYVSIKTKCSTQIKCGLSKNFLRFLSLCLEKRRRKIGKILHHFPYESLKQANFPCWWLPFAIQIHRIRIMAVQIKWSNTSYRTKRKENKKFWCFWVLPVSNFLFILPLQRWSIFIIRDLYKRQHRLCVLRNNPPNEKNQMYPAKKEEEICIVYDSKHVPFE